LRAGVRYLYLDFSLKPAVVGCLCTQKKILGWGCGFFVSDVISEVVLGPFRLMLPGLGSNC